MIIKNVDIKHYRIPLRTEMTDAMHGVMTHFEVIMVRLESDDGAQGLGYTYTIGQAGATIYSLIEQALKPILLGANPRCIEQLWEKMWWQLHYIGRGGVVSFAMRSCRCSRARPKPSACAAAVIPTEAPWMTCAGVVPSLRQQWAVAVYPAVRDLFPKSGVEWTPGVTASITTTVV